MKKISIYAMLLIPAAAIAAVTLHHELKTQSHSEQKAEITIHCSRIKHDWHFSPYYLSVAVSIEEPTYYSPQGYTAVLVCSECGMLRLPDNMKGVKGYVDTVNQSKPESPYLHPLSDTNYFHPKN